MDMRVADPAGGVGFAGMLGVRPAAAGGVFPVPVPVPDIIGMISVAKEQSATDLLIRRFDLLLSV